MDKDNPMIIEKEQKISMVRFSPNGLLLCVGVAPPISLVKIYEVKNNLNLKGNLSGVPKAIL